MSCPRTASGYRAQAAIGSLCGRLREPHHVSQPPLLVLEPAAQPVDPVRLVPPLVPALDVDLGRGESRLEHRVLDLGQGPEPPVVAEGALELGSVGEPEVDVAEEVVVDWVECG